MESRVKSIFKLGAKTLNKHSVDAIKDTITNHRQSMSINDTYQLNHFIGADFFEGDNYKSILRCLDGGYAISVDLIEYLQDYCDLLQTHIDSLNVYHKKWKSKLKGQELISSYHTTKRAQIQTVGAAGKVAQCTKTLADTIQIVIDQYRKQVDKMYPSGKLGTTHKHYRTEAMKDRFKTAQSSLSKTRDKLAKLREKEEKARDNLRKANILCQNLGLDSTTSESKLTRANEAQKKAEDEMAAIKLKISEVDDELEDEQTTYRENATVLFKQCQEFENERIEQIRQTLLNFSQAIHSSDYSATHDVIYEDLLTKIKDGQSTSDDLQFWEQTYGVNSLTKSISSETEENEQITSTNQEEPQSVTENDENAEEQPTEVATTTPAKTKSKKSKSTAATEKKTSSTPESTISNTSELNQV